MAEPFPFDTAGEPTVFTKSELPPDLARESGPGHASVYGLSVRSGPKTRKAAALNWIEVLWYLRQAAIRWPAVRDHLDHMVASLPER